MNMENSHTLATESFSYSWLTDGKPHFSDEFRTTASADQLNEPNFNFDVSISSSSHDVSLVHADEIFSDGHIMPVYISSKSLKISKSVPQSPVSSYYSPEKDPFSVSGTKNPRVGKWRKYSYKRILQKCFGFVKPFCKKTIGFSRKSIRVDDLERKVCEVQSWSNNNSLEASPRRSSAYSVVDWSDLKKKGDRVEFYYGLKKVKSWNGSSQFACSSPGLMSPSHSINSWCDAESSIHEAILYCKRSIEK